VFEAGKIVQESRAESLWPEAGHVLDGYEIHHGRTFLCGSRGEAVAQGGVAVGWRCERGLGTYLHGILGSDTWRGAFLNQVRAARGLPAQVVQTSEPIEHRIRRWAEHVKRHLRPGAWERILGALRP
jgi:adenosylcobyric acid synthase